MSAPRGGLLIVNARPWSDGRALAGADTLAVDGNRIAAVGRRAEIEARTGGAAQVIDARGATLTPGLWDAHLHLLPWARARFEIDLTGSPSRAEACARIRRHLNEHPGSGPVLGRGWDAGEWSEQPARGALDALEAHRPLLLHSHDFHTLWVNSAALARAGIGRGTPDPPGGRIERDPGGEPTGVLRENAVKALAALEDEATRAAGDAGMLLADAARALHAFGVTAVHDFERGAAAFGEMERFARGAGPRVRVLQCVGPEDLERVAGLGLASGAGDDHFRVGPLKLFADGTLGSRTAALLAPYDGTEEMGLDVLPPDELSAWVARGLAQSLAVAVHAIGDRACRHALDAFERAASRSRPVLPNRIEHAQLVAPPDLPRFAALGVAASMQPLHCTADAPLAARWWGSRRDQAYPWRTLLESGARLAFGSDAPVESPSLAEGLGAACTRQRADGTPPGGFVPAQRVGLDEALRAYTEGAARLAGAWPRIGSLREGSLADLVVWDRDLARTPAEQLREARPSCTVWDGAVVHGPQAVAS
jgi:predicted amidohydrolase YtcJ